MQQCWRALLLLGFFSALSGHAQPYQPMLGHSTEWLIKSCEFGNCLYDYYWCVKDSSYSGKAYKVLEGYHYNGNFLLREDVAQQMVYLLTSAGSSLPTEYLLYDFSLAVGDSIFLENPISPIFSDRAYFTLDSTGTRTTNGNIRRVFHLSTKDTSTTFSYAQWVEGVGSTALINTPGAHADSTAMAALVCANRNGEAAYVARSSDSCYSNPQLSVKEWRKAQSPSFGFDRAGTFWVDELPAHSQLKFYSLSGSLLGKREFPDGCNSCKIDLPQGTALVVIQQPDLNIHHSLLVPLGTRH